MVRNYTVISVLTSQYYALWVIPFSRVCRLAALMESVHKELKTLTRALKQPWALTGLAGVRVKVCECKTGDIGAEPRSADPLTRTHGNTSI